MNDQIVRSASGWERLWRLQKELAEEWRAEARKFRFWAWFWFAFAAAEFVANFCGWWR